MSRQVADRIFFGCLGTAAVLLLARCRSKSSNCVVALLRCGMSPDLICKSTCDTGPFSLALHAPMHSVHGHKEVEGGKEEEKEVKEYACATIWAPLSQGDFPLRRERCRVAISVDSPRRFLRARVCIETRHCIGIASSAEQPTDPLPRQNTR